MRKKVMRLFILILTSLSLLTGCSPIVSDFPDTTDIFATVYPLYALTQRIAEGSQNTEIHCLVQPQDECLRSYTLSDWDLYMLAYSADVVISGGNGLESFQERLRVMGETAFPLAEVLLDIPMEQIDTVAPDDDSHYSGEIPHTYMSLNHVSEIVANIAGALSILDAANADTYEANSHAIQSQLNELIQSIERQTSICTNVRAAILHEALIYPAKECGLDIAAAFERESGEMLYSGTLNECLETLNQKKIQLVLLEKQAPQPLLEILSDKGYTVVQLDVLSTHQEKDGYIGYIDSLADNARLIINACKEISQ